VHSLHIGRFTGAAIVQVPAPVASVQPETLDVPPADPALRPAPEANRRR
jgi:hypothetical protein